jgi:hypothetical protein
MTICHLSGGLPDLNQSSKRIDTEIEGPTFFQEFMRINLTMRQLSMLTIIAQQKLPAIIAWVWNCNCSHGRGDKGEMLHATDTKQLMDEDGTSVGWANWNPLVHSRKYAVEYADEDNEKLSAGIIKETSLLRLTTRVGDK